MNVLISGGLGFVGINMVRDICQMHPDVNITAADVLEMDEQIEKFLQPVREHVHVYKLDVRDRNAYRRAVEKNYITHIIHAAAITPTAIQEKQNTSLIIDVNLGGAINALTVAQESSSVEALVLCSSNAVYQLREMTPGETISEEDPLDLNSLYTITKRSSELLGSRLWALKEKRVTTVRFPSVYGPMERPTGSREKMSLMCQLKDACLQNKSIRIFGPDVTRDWQHTHNISQALSGLLTAPVWNYPVYNVGSGKLTAISDITSALVERGMEITWVDQPDNADIVLSEQEFRGMLDITRIQRDTSYKPQVDPIRGMDDYLQAP